jgi:hypothetical protein
MFFSRELAAVLLVAAACGQRSALAGHELPFYPSFYPQEVRIETLDPIAAAAGWAKARVHAYVGDGLFADGTVPPNAGAVTSLRSYLVLTLDPAHSERASGSGGAQSRCAAAERMLRPLAQSVAGYVFHPYPVTPYHADYLQQSDLAMHARARYASKGDDGDPSRRLKIRARGPLAELLVPAAWKAQRDEWDATLEEIDAGKLTELSAGGPSRQATVPWIKQGWFQAYLLYSGISRERAARFRVEDTYRRLVTGGYRNATERINLERTLVTTLVAGCGRVVVGYTLRHEYFNSEYAGGIENIGFDSQAGLMSVIFPRTVKLKDFPWNGWLRLGVATAPTAAWNPIGGFGGAFGRLLWSAIADPALLPTPYGGSWIANRASVTEEALPRAGIPADALRPEIETGLMRRVGAGKIARQRLRVALVASAFHDGTATGVADIVYPYIFAFRQAARRPGDRNSFDPEIARSTAPVRDWLAGFKVIAVNTQTRNFGSDLQFSYRVPVVDVYLKHRSTDAWEAAAIATPWSTLPWDLIVLMEEAVERGIAALSEGEARRRGIPWLDLVRDRTTLEQLASLVERFRVEGYRPLALQDLVTREEAQLRWTALAAFYAKHHHFLVTNGPYQLDAWSAGSATLQVFRDLTYPLGVGTFDEYAIPLKAYVVQIQDSPDRIVARVEVERVSRFQRSYEIERSALAPAAGDPEDDTPPQCRYVVVAPNGDVVRTGSRVPANDGALVLDLKGLRPGLYTVLAALYLRGNAIDPEVAVIAHRATGSATSRHGAKERQRAPAALQ